MTGGDLADLCQPLADAIEALIAERDGLLRCVTDNHVALCRAETAEAERDRLRDAIMFWLEAEEPDVEAAINMMRACAEGRDEMSDLKPCPFCGSEASHNDGGGSVFGRFWWTVGCKTCDVWLSDKEVWSQTDHGMLDPAYPPKHCFAAWNTRALPAVQPGKEVMPDVPDADSTHQSDTAPAGLSAGGGAEPTAVQPMTVRLVFNNADATPKTTVLDVSAEAVPDIMAWYGAYCAGDRYTATVDGRNVPMDQNGEPPHVNKTPKSEHDATNVLTPATKGAAHD